MPVNDISTGAPEQGQSQPCHSSDDNDQLADGNDMDCCDVDGDKLCLQHCSAVAMALPSLLQRAGQLYRSGARFQLNPIELHAPFQLEILRPPITTL